MAIRINAGDDVKRGDMFHISPDNIIIDPDLRGRHKVPTEHAVKDMAISMLTTGQINPIQCRRVEDNLLKLNSGFTRHEAAKMICAGFTDHDGKQQCEPEFKLKVTVTDINEKQAFESNIVENAHRNQTSPIDDAYNQKRLRDMYGYSDSDISKLYQYPDPSKVSKLRKLLILPDNIQTMIHVGKISTMTGVSLAGLPVDEQKQIILESKNNSDDIDLTEVKKRIRNFHMSKPKHEKPASMSRSISELRSFFKWHVESSKTVPSRDFGLAMLDYIAGVSTDNNMSDLLDTLLKQG